MLICIDDLTTLLLPVTLACFYVHAKMRKLLVVYGLDLVGIEVMTVLGDSCNN